MNVITAVKTTALKAVANTPIARANAKKSAEQYPDCMSLIVKTCRIDGKGNIVLKSSNKIIGWIKNGIGWMEPKGYELMQKDADAMADTADDYDDYDEDDGEL